VFKPDGLLQAALDLLSSCPSCSDDRGYTGGCPACIQAGECIKFNDFLCKSSALKIGKHLLARMQKTELYKKNEKESKEELAGVSEASDSETSTCEKKQREKDMSSPRRKKRQRAVRAAKDIERARQRQMVVGRPSWPLDRSNGPHHQNA
jgi:ATP-dependent helicase YprA (DUF1998 family)